METKWFSIKFVDEFPAGWHQLEHPIHVPRMDTVKVHCVWMPRAVDEIDANAIPFRCTERGTGNAPVVGPCFVLNARCHLYCLYSGENIVLAHCLTIR
jgi:hypothetical protein